ncbi:branched-chain amino acid transport system II carrier protein [Brevibacillus laterosporus]|uniref:branched-chain amino acid transport system II carrier protein n=1 Tax=Brevibacillus laterosporus TaxID=1465 RepID=UPI003D2372AE
MNNSSLRFSQILTIGLLLFAIFFGVGNVIFPPALGQAAGTNMWITIIGFIVTDVGLSLLAIIAVALAGGSFDKLGAKVHPTFATVLSIVIYLAIGPLFVIPRTGTVSFEMSVAPVLSEGNAGRWCFLFIFFVITYLLSLNPTKLVDRIGKILTPVFLVMIGVILAKALISPMGAFAEPTGDYAEIPFFKGFLEGFLTLDAIGALVISVIVVNTIKQYGVTERKAIAKNMIYAGIIASIGLMLVYFALGYIGASSVSLGVASNGGELLTNVMNHLFGASGNLLLGAVIIFACLTTAVGVTAAFGNYFSKMLPGISYKKIVLAVCLFSFGISNLGLNALLQVTGPVLMVLYPIIIVLIVLSFLDKYITGKPSVYIVAMTVATIFSLLQVLEEQGWMSESIIRYVQMIPFYQLKIGWMVPATIGAIVGYVMPQKPVKKRGEINIQ